jgi:hypothetical protein
MMTAQAVKTYSVPTGRIRVADDGSVIQDPPTGNAAGAELVRLVDACARAYAMTWGEAFEHVRASQEGHEILRRYGQRPVPPTRNHSGGNPRIPTLSARPDLEIDRRARLHMDYTGEASYSRAVAFVLNADPELRRSYANLC